MEALTSLSFKGSLSRVDTFDDLSTIQCEDGSDVDDDDDIEVLISLIRTIGTILIFRLSNFTLFYVLR